jgi:DnaJ family protein C protein 28
MTEPLDLNSGEKGSDGRSPAAKKKKPPRRSLARQRDLVEEIITAAQEEGKFDDLPGRGRPLSLRKNPYAPEWDLAHRLLKDNDLVPVWIMERKALLSRIDALRRQIAAAWERGRAAYADPRRRDQAVICWDDACKRWQKEIIALNQDVTDFNLGRPFDHLEIYTLSLDAELERVDAPRWLR